MSTIKGIDVSHYQGVIDFEKVKASGMSFVFAKASQGTAYVDNMFNTNYEKAKKAGLKFGAYHYGTFSTVAEAQVEAKHFLAVLKDKVLTYPAVLDIEENKKGVGRTQLTDASIAFLEVLESAGYFAMIYSGKYFFESYLYPDKLAPYAQWIARYGVADLGRKAGIWQYASDGKVNGVIGNCDMNYAYADYSFTSPKAVVHPVAPVAPVVAPKPTPTQTPAPTPKPTPAPPVVAPIPTPEPVKPVPVVEPVVAPTPVIIKETPTPSPIPEAVKNVETVKPTNKIKSTFKLRKTTYLALAAIVYSALSQFHLIHMDSMNYQEIVNGIAFVLGTAGILVSPKK